MLAGVLAALLCLLSASGAGAAGGPAALEPPRLTRPLVSHTAAHLIVYCSLRDGFAEGLEGRLKAGIALEIEFRIELRRARDRWPDRKEASRKIVRTVSWDGLRQEYLFTHRDPDRTWSRTTGSFAEITSLLGELRGATVCEYDRLGAGRRYYVRIRARLKSEGTAVALRRFFFLAGSGPAESPWAVSPYFSVTRRNRP